MPFGLPRVTFAQVFRLVQTVAVPLIFAWVARELITRFSPADSDGKKKLDPSLYSPLLEDIGFQQKGYPVTYGVNADLFQDYERVDLAPSVTTGRPDTTAVILNWARFPNVLLITAQMCSPELEGIIAQILIWNNTPRPLSYEDFKNTGCAPWRLNIVNSYGNVLFQGRYLGCSRADTPYCFIQDDDYLVRSEVIQALHARLVEPNASPVIHLLPPQEHLSTSLREIHVKHPETSYLSDVHTSFAWLGYGTIMQRSQAVKFITLMRELGLSQNEIVMADNYFTILSNRVPEIWFDQNFELGGGYAFSVGEEGDERNEKHIRKATQYLNSALLCRDKICDVAQKKLARTRLSYLSTEPATNKPSWNHAACRGSACVLETNIRLLPDTLSHTSNNVENILTLETANRELLGESGIKHYVTYPLSHAVDTQIHTAFRSPGDARKGDIISLDILADISDAHEWKVVEMAMLVDSETEEILNASTFEFSTDNQNWHATAHNPICDDVTAKLPQEEGSDAPTSINLRECSVRVESSMDDLHVRATGRYFRARLREDRPKQWTIYEFWLRGY